MVPVKKLGEYMSVEHLAAFCSASFTRTVMMYKFSNMIKDRTPTYGYGYAQNVPVYPESLKRLKDAGQYVLYIPHCFDEEAAKRAIRNIVKEVGGEK